MKLRSGRTISAPIQTATTNPHCAKRNSVASADTHSVKQNGLVSLAHFQRKCDGFLRNPNQSEAEPNHSTKLNVGWQSKTAIQPLKETVYDYIVRRNGIINEVKLHLFQLTLIKNLDEQLIQIDKICSAFIAEFDYLMKYKFEPTKRFIQLIHSKTLEWMNQYPSRRDLLFKLHDMTHI